MIGAIIGDIVGSRFEWDNYRAKDFELFTDACFPTDDSIMTVAVGKAILDCDGAYGDLSAKTVSCMQKLGRRYPHCGYGGRFYHWIFGNDPKPYYSFGNGAAMRVSAVGFARTQQERGKNTLPLGHRDQPRPSRRTQRGGIRCDGDLPCASEQNQTTDTRLYRAELLQNRLYIGRNPRHLRI